MVKFGLEWPIRILPVVRKLAPALLCGIFVGRSDLARAVTWLQRAFDEFAMTEMDARTTSALLEKFRPTGPSNTPGRPRGSNRCAPQRPGPQVSHF